MDDDDIHMVCEGCTHCLICDGPLWKTPMWCLTPGTYHEWYPLEAGHSY